jgi:dephospho-CoA kinase
MFILGLTGSIGMGKSTAAGLFAAGGIPVYDADAAVHRLYAGKAVTPVSQAFPEAVIDGCVDRARLSSLVVGDSEALKRLEAIVHPLVRAEEAAFLRRAAQAGATLAVLEIPLLLETGGDTRVDAVAVVSALPEIQRRRVLDRPGMSDEKLAKILARQMPDADKRRRAHFVIDSGRGLAPVQKEVDDIRRALAGRPGAAYGRILRQASARPANASEPGPDARDRAGYRNNGP